MMPSTAALTEQEHSQMTDMLEALKKLNAAFLGIKIEVPANRMPAILEASECARAAIAAAEAEPVGIATADAFVVVSRWQNKAGHDIAGGYDYDLQLTLNDAIDAYQDYVNGEYSRARAIGIFAVRNGMPCGNLDPQRIMELRADK